MSPCLSGSGESERFSCYFRKLSREIEEEIKHLSNCNGLVAKRIELTERCLLAVERLAGDVRDAATFIPAHDQKAFLEVLTHGIIIWSSKANVECLERIKMLQEEMERVREASNPKSRFSFRSSRKVGFNSSASPHALQDRTTPSVSLCDESKLLTEHAARPNTTSVSSTEDAGAYVITISNKTNEYVTLPKSFGHCPITILLSDMTLSGVDLTRNKNSRQIFASVTLRRISDCVILGGSVDGPVHLNGLQNVIVIVTCQQFRMHNSETCKIYLHCPTRPIIENCKDIYFAPLPKPFAADKKVSDGSIRNQIDDFNWLKIGKSPNWSLLPNDDRVPDHIWSELVVEDLPTALENIFKILKLRKV